MIFRNVFCNQELTFFQGPQNNFVDVRAHLITATSEKNKNKKHVGKKREKKRKKEKKMKRSKRKAVIDLSDEEKSEEEMSLDQTDNGVVTVCPVADCDREQISARDVESAVQKDCVANETNNTMSDQDDLDVEQFGPQVSGVKPDGKGFRLSGTKFLLTFPKQ